MLGELDDMLNMVNFRILSLYGNIDALKYQLLFWSKDRNV